MTTPEQPRKQRVVLTRKQSFQIAEWVKQNMPAIKQEKFTQDQACVRIARELNIPLERKQLSRVVADAGIEWPFGGPARTAGNKRDRHRLTWLWVRSMLQVQDRIVDAIQRLEGGDLWAGITPVNRELLDRLIGGKRISHIQPTESEKGD